MALTPHFPASDQQDPLLQHLAEALPAAIAEFDVYGELVCHNEAWTRFTGLTVGPGVVLADVLAVSVGEPDPPEPRQVVETGRQVEVEVIATNPATSRWRRCELSLRPLRSPLGQPTGVLASLTDITDSWMLERQLARQATTDRLTGLKNRDGVLSAIRNSFEQQPAGRTGVFCINLDDFKTINGRFGYRSGDGLLVKVGQAIEHEVDDGDVVGRLGGDTFAIVSPDLGTRDQTIDKARRIATAITGAWAVDGDVIRTSASCGVAVKPGWSISAESLVAHADLAMQEHKRSQQSDPVIFSPQVLAANEREIELTDALTSAPIDDSLEMHYQPIISLDTGALVAFEGLVRWHVGDDLVLPAEFVGLAERKGLIADIGRWVIDNVCREAALYRSRHADEPCYFTLNVSPQQLSGGELVDQVSRSLDRFGLPASSLMLEFTEGVLITKSTETLATLDALRNLGVRLVVDDFGTGFAGLDYLRSLPMDGLKIDRCFVSDLDNPRTVAILTAMVDLARRLEMTVTAEGIETDEQRARVTALGAKFGQGYLFDRPAPITTFI